MLDLVSAIVVIFYLLFTIEKNAELGRVKSANNGDIPPMMRVITRLWCHETSRIFGDRIVGAEGRCT